MFYGTFLSLLPPVIAIILALISKQVYLSLFVGVAVGSLLLADFSAWGSFELFTDTLVSNTDLTIVLFLILISIVIVLIRKSGGAYAYGNWAASKMKSKRSALLATSLLGCIIFMDDGFNCLTVGSVMMPVTDKFKISRAKLAYIIDATAAPICIIAPVSSWAAAINSYVPDGYALSGFELFVRAIPFNFYAILTLIMVFCTSAAGFDFGIMKKYEDAAAKTPQVADTLNVEKGNGKGRVIDLVLPMIFVIFAAIGAMIWTGHLEGGTTLIECFANCASAKSLVFASLMAILFCGLLYLPRKTMSFKDYMEAIPEGAQLMMPFIVILVLAWTLKGLISGLGASDYINSVVSLNGGVAALMPLILFGISAFVSFSSGTSWGTFAIMVPITVSLFASDVNMLTLCVAACLAGGVTGDHISPISDTTIMSSTGAGADHIEHVKSQIEYQIPVIVCTCAAYLIAGLTKTFYIALPVSVIMLVGILNIIRIKEK